jgi:hypothetical protein
VDINANYLTAMDAITCLRSHDRLFLSHIAIIVVSLLLMTACSSSKSQSNNTDTIAPQTPPPAGPINSYFGTNGDLWNVSIDHVNSQLTAKNVTNGVILAGSAAGTFITSGGFLDIALSNGGTPPDLVGQEGGFALDIPSRAALLRLGNPSNPLIPLVATVGCFTTSGKLTYQYVTVPTPAWQSSTDVAYGTFQASAAGPNWSFSNITQYTLAGTAPTNPGAGLPPGYCAQSTLGFAVTASSSATSPPLATVTMAFSPSGFFLEDNGSQQGAPQGVVPSNALGTGVGAIGVVQPSTPLSTGSVTGAHYLGFMYEPVSSPPLTAEVAQLVAFGCSGMSCPTPPSSTAIVGGTFPNEDPTQPSTQNMVIDLGQQDPQRNGLYTSAQVTLSGVTFPAVAIVGTPQNHFAIFLIAQDTLNRVPLSIYLFQQ